MPFHFILSSNSPQNYLCHYFGTTLENHFLEPTVLETALRFQTGIVYCNILYHRNTVSVHQNRSFTCIRIIRSALEIYFDYFSFFPWENTDLRWFNNNTNNLLKQKHKAKSTQQFIKHHARWYSTIDKGPPSSPLETTDREPTY